ncbi:EAL domain-containing protein [Brenneria nigrifluens DSM 30175 = ATCC 13028]|uniref:EAL domain-containing protein n=2 Tax=Brenneria nigrifluens TaxID=55210 RepID=A0A2U1US68_9GAMM|nr:MULTISPECIES: EAL domain-containing protein [Brenneria]EHD21072.1 diguanylate phosphodiesterase [Brenneria sp. EniD312]PWC24495.1 EAL domain-containing protein [Brenneria nigrifluens DSM 30175 = ATCC 13028]QCR04224.1 EAL domain-containing protein [Brenneria nigrifluens DSM 30175 = ATCC 13028]
MLIRLEVDYVSEYVFWPIYSLEGRLLAVEMISRFNSRSGNLSIPPDILFNVLSKSQKHDFIKEQLAFITNNADWFIDKRILLALKVDADTVDFLLASKTVRNDITNLPFVQLEINELFPDLMQGKENTRLLRLSKSFDLWLDNFGSGKSNLKPLHDGLLSTLKMDQHLVEHLLSRSSNTLIMEPLLRIIKNYYPRVRVIVKGIDTADCLAKVSNLNINGLQGNLWPAVHLDELKTQIDFSR